MTACWACGRTTGCGCPGWASKVFDIWVGSVVDGRIITQPEKWDSAGNPYLLRWGTVTVRSSSVGGDAGGSVAEVGAGAEVVMGAGARLQVGYYSGNAYPGNLLVSGMGASPVVFRSATGVPGSWAEILVSCVHTDYPVRLRHVRIEEAQRGLYLYRASSSCSWSKPELEDVELRDSQLEGLKAASATEAFTFRRGVVEGSGGVGIVTNGGGGGTVVDSVLVSRNAGGGIEGGFAGSNRVRENVGWAVSMSADQSVYLDAQLEVTGNEQNYVRLTAASLTEDVVWLDQPAPYWVDGTVMVRSTGSGATVTPPLLEVGAGAEVVMGAGARLQVGYYYASNYLQPGNLLVSGTSASPVVFRSATGVPGSWAEILVQCVHTDYPVRLRHVRIQDAGRGLYLSKGTYCSWSKPELEDVELRNSQLEGLKAASATEAFTFRRGVVEGSGGVGIVTNGGSGGTVVDSVLVSRNAGGGIAGGFAGSNRVRENGGWAVSMSADQSVYLDAQLEVTGNEQNYVRLTAASLTEDVVWLDQPAPYWVDGTVMVRSTGSGATVTPPLLEVGAGAEVVMGAGARLQVGYYYASNYLQPGNLLVSGTSASPVVFRSATGVPGSWAEILVQCVHTDYPVRLRHVRIQDAGRGLYLSKGTYCSWSKPELEDVELRNSQLEGLKAASATEAFTFRRGVVEGSGGVGIVTNGGGGGTVVDSVLVSRNAGGGIEGGFAGSNRVRENVGWAVSMSADQSVYLDAQLEVTGNEQNYVRLTAADLREDVIWLDQPAPYWVDGTVMVRSTGSGATVTPPLLEVGAGAEVVMGAGARLQVGYYYASNYLQPGNLLVSGTSGSPVVFRSATGVPGSWAEILVQCVHTDYPVRLRHVRIQDAGRGLYLSKGTYCSWSKPILNYLTFQTISQYGIHATSAFELLGPIPE